MRDRPGKPALGRLHLGCPRLVDQRLQRRVVAEDVGTGWLAVLPAETADTLGPVGLTTRIDTVLPLPAQLLAVALRELVARRAVDKPPRG